MNRASSCGLVVMALTFAAKVSESLAAPVECGARTCGDWTQEESNKRCRTCKTPLCDRRPGSSLNLNIHFHILALDGVFIEAKRENQKPDARPRFHRVPAPSREELTTLLHTISMRLARYLERRGLLTRDAENSYLTLEEEGESPRR